MIVRNLLSQGRCFLIEKFSVTKMRINHAREGAVHVQASLFRCTEMAVQWRDKQLRQHDDEQHYP